MFRMTFHLGVVGLAAVASLAPTVIQAAQTAAATTTPAPPPKAKKPANAVTTAQHPATPAAAKAAPKAATQAVPPRAPQSVATTARAPLTAAVPARSALPASTVAAPAGRAPIPTPQANSTVMAAPAPAGRSPIPTPATSTTPSAASSILSGPSGRGAIPLPGQSAQPAGSPAAAGRGPAGAAVPQGALGIGQWGNTILTVYGCTRQGSTVLCDTDLSNQRQGNTQFNAQYWFHTFLIDDRGDRHRRASAYFLNADGQPREMLDIPYGQSARYILVFNDVSTNAATAKLISTGAELNVENISLDGQQAQSAQAAAQPAQAGAQPAQAAAQPGAVQTATANTAGDLKATAQDTKDKAAATAGGRANQTLDRIFNRGKK